MNTRSISYKLAKCYEFLSLLNVELYLFAWTFVYNMKSVPTSQMVQDKVCRNLYHLNTTYCAGLSSMADSDDDLGMKSTILTDGMTWMKYAITLITVPSVIASLFVGSWADTYVKARKIMLMAGAVAIVLEMIILIVNDYVFELSHFMMLFAAVPITCTGGVLPLLSSIYSYMAATTPPNMRAIRLTIAEIISSLAEPLGTYVGGLVLNTTPLFSTGQLHNSSVVFIIGGVVFVLTLIWTVFMVDERRDVGEWERRFNRLSDTETDEEVAKRVGQKLQKYDDNRHIHPIKMLLNFNNVREMWRTCTKPRDEWTRLQIWLLLLSMACYLVSHTGPVIIMFHFSQRVYDWDSQQYTTIAAIGSVVMTLGTFIIAPVLIKVFKLRDPVLAMIGSVSYFPQNIIRGVVLTYHGYYVSLLPGCLGSLGAIGIRTHLSKIIEPSELGKVFSSMGAIEAISPLIASGIFLTIFNATIDTAPGLTLLLVAALMVVPFVVMVWIRFFTVLPVFPRIITDETHEDCTSDQMYDKQVI